ncbi:MAG TPA: rRNA maturation RNase YbeY [Actinomycetes bacterium]|nr:rRNA maturation RNase YbeY [Actinomycetes bacterium]
MSVAVNNESDETVDELGLAELAQFVLDEMQIHAQAELSIMVVDEPTMTHLHEHFMNEPGPTDVLAFPMDELRPMPEGDDVEPGLLGDVVLCPAIAARQAQQAGHSPDDELRLLCAHGTLHLLGYDHHDPEGERTMFGLQAKLLAAWQSSRSGGTR